MTFDTLYNIIFWIFFSIPILFVVNWIYRIVKYRQAKNENEINPGTYSDEEMKSLKVKLIIASVIVGVFAAIIVGFMILFALSIIYM